ncbi:hypothetical protein LI078_16525, partial [Stenotrophomonas maltophilia]|nr:hypothetical protein [Stenotrophomonas maltophilia]
MQGQPEEPASILAVVGAGVQRVQTTQSSKAVEHGSTLQKPVSVVAMFIVSTKVDTHQEQLMPFRQQRETVEGGVGPVAGVSAAWMPRPSPQGRVYGVPRN